MNIPNVDEAAPLLALENLESLSESETKLEEDIIPSKNWLEILLGYRVTNVVKQWSNVITIYRSQKSLPSETT